MKKLGCGGIQPHLKEFGLNSPAFHSLSLLLKSFLSTYSKSPYTASILLFNLNSLTTLEITLSSKKQSSEFKKPTISPDAYSKALLYASPGPLSF